MIVLYMLVVESTVEMGNFLIHYVMIYDAFCSDE